MGESARKRVSHHLTHRIPVAPEPTLLPPTQPSGPQPDRLKGGEHVGAGGAVPRPAAAQRGFGLTWLRVSSLASEFCKKRKGVDVHDWVWFLEHAQKMLLYQEMKYCTHK